MPTDTTLTSTTPNEPTYSENDPPNAVMALVSADAQLGVAETELEVVRRLLSYKSRKEDQKFVEEAERLENEIKEMKPSLKTIVGRVSKVNEARAIRRRAVNLLEEVKLAHGFRPEVGSVNDPPITSTLSISMPETNCRIMKAFEKG